MMNLRKSLIWGGYVLFFMIAFPLVGVRQHRTFAQNPADRSDLRDRVAIQEKLLYAYAYAWDSKDCVGWANLFTADAVVSTAIKATGRDALLQACIERQKNVVDATKTRHNMINIVFDQLTPTQAKTRTYLVLTWQKPGDRTPSIQEVGTYRDVIVKQSDGRWLFKERVLVSDSD
ncbi:MAG TPA: nuclear transport factor 2 family protein [Blastocatellia bacterium]|nr:nuclear transport factor 2 family protein [Blastocatellia bacterium]